MRGPCWWFSLPALLVALFAQCASARQQSQDLTASPVHHESPAAWKEAPVTDESPTGARAAHETASRAATSRREAPASREIPNATTVARENQNRAPAVHESRKNEPPA